MNKNIKNIICPECENLSIINYNDSKISIEKCVNNHKISDLSLESFLYLQYYNDKSKMKCIECENKTAYYIK